MLTAEQVETLGGLRLDLAVAEHFLGWRWWKSSGSGRRCLYAPGANPSWMQTPADGSEEVVGDWDDGDVIGLPHSATSWAAAGMLMEEAVSRDWLLFVGPDNTPGGGWAVQYKDARSAGEVTMMGDKVRQFRPSSVHGWARGKTGPEAVARAILLLCLES